MCSPVARNTQHSSGDTGQMASRQSWHKWLQRKEMTLILYLRWSLRVASSSGLCACVGAQVSEGSRGPAGHRTGERNQVRRNRVESGMADKPTKHEANKKKKEEKEKKKEKPTIKRGGNMLA